MRFLAVTIFTFLTFFLVGIVNAATINSSLPNQSSLNNGLVGWWTFDGADCGATYCIDKSGMGNTGALTATTKVKGKTGQALKFDAATTCIGAGNDSSVQLSTGTVSAWIKTDGSVGDYRAIVVKQNAYGMFLLDNVLVLYDYGGAAARTTGVNLADNKWHHVLFSFQSAVSNGTKIYINGELRTTTEMTVSNQTVALAIGASGACSGIQNFSGLIDDARIYNRILTAKEIKMLYQQGDISGSLP